MSENHEQKPAALENQQDCAIQGKKARGNRKSKRQKGIFSSNIYQVLKKAQEQMAISKGAMAVMDSFMGDMLEQLSAHASQLASRDDRADVSVKDLESAVRLVLPQQLGEFANLQGHFALDRYSNAST